MKSRRQSKILEIISKEDIETQEQLLAELRPLSISRAYSWKDNLWILMAKVSFEGTCRLRNLIFERE